MAFEWLDRFHRQAKKREDYAARTLAAYRMGMKAGGSIAGVKIELGADSCAEARALPLGTVYHPDEAPLLPLENCPNGRRCRCVYRPVMSYQQGDDK